MRQPRKRKPGEKLIKESHSRVPGASKPRPQQVEPPPGRRGKR